MLRLNTALVERVLSEEKINLLSAKVPTVDTMIREKTGLGSDFLGWVDLPLQYAT